MFRIRSQYAALKVVATAIAVAVCAGAIAQKQPPDPLKSDERLKKTVDMRATDEPIADFVKRMSAQIGVELSAADGIADDKISLRVREREAGNLMAAIARHFDARWRQTGAAYVLQPTAEGRDREALLRERARKRELAAIDDRMRALQALLPLTDEQLASRDRDLKDRLGAADLKKQERAQLADEQQAIGDLKKTGGRVAVAIFSGLDLAQRTALARGEEVRIADPGPALAAEIHKAAEQRGSGMVMVRATATSRDATPPPVNTQPSDLPPLAANAAFRIAPADELGLGMNVPSDADSRPRLKLNVTMTSVRGQSNMQQMRPLFWSPDVHASPDRRAPLPTTSADPDMNREVELKLTVAPRGSGEPSIVASRRSFPAGSPSIGEALQKLSDATGQEFLSDSYVRAQVDPASVRGAHKVLDIVNSLATSLDYSYEKTGGLLCFRSDTYFDDRPSEAPARLLKPVSDRVAHGDTTGLNDYAALAADLTDAQIKSLDRFWDIYFRGVDFDQIEGMGGMYGLRQDLRLWAILDDAERSAALAGEVVPVAGMTQRQADAFVVALLARQSGPALAPALSGEPTRPDVAAGGFSLKVGSARQLTMSGGDTGSGPVKARMIVMNQVETSGGSSAGPPPPISPQASIKGPDGMELDLSAGKEQVLDSFNFRYHLSNNANPAKVTTIMLPHKAKKTRTTP